MKKKEEETMENDQGSELYAKYLSGDETAFADLIRLYRVRLIGFLEAVVGNSAIAEELAEDVFASLAIKKPKDSRRSSFKTWLYTMARNRAVSYLRFHGRRQTVPIDDLAETAEGDPSPEETYLKSERDRAVRRALSELRPIYREVLWLRYFEGKNNAEIAGIVGKSTHAVEEAATRARAALRNKLEKEGFSYENV